MATLEILRCGMRSVRTLLGLGACGLVRKSRPVSSRKGSSGGADDHGDAVGGHPAATSEQRRRGNTATAESRNRATVCGETRELATRPSRARRRRRPAGRNPQHGRQAPRWRARAWSWNGALATASPCGEASELRRSPLRLHADCRRRPSGRLRFGLRRTSRHGREVRHERAFPTCGNAGRSPR